MSSRYLSIRIYTGADIMVTIRLTLDKTLKKLNMSRYELAKLTGIRYHILDNYYKNKVVRYDSYVLGRICDALSCQISDLLEAIEIVE